MAQQPDKVTATAKGGSFTPHPEGQFAARCVDVIDFGEKVETYPGKPERLVHKVGLVYRTGEVNEQGEPIDVLREFTVSMYETANLRQFLEAWRGKTYTGDEVEAGAPLDKLCGVTALVTIEHKTSGQGRTYANLKGIAPLPKMMQSVAPDGDDYTRPEYLLARKAKYAEDAAAYKKRINAPVNGKALAGAMAGHAPAQDDDDSLPF